MIKLHQCWHDFDISSYEFNELVEWAKSNNLPLFIHIKNLEQVLYFTAVANKHSNAVLLLRTVSDMKLFPLL